MLCSKHSDNAHYEQQFNKIIDLPDFSYTFH